MALAESEVASVGVAAVDVEGVFPPPEKTLFSADTDVRRAGGVAEGVEASLLDPSILSAISC